MPSSSRRTTSAVFEWVFKPDEAVHDVHASLLERSGPHDVGLFVEAGLELHQRRHLFPRSAARMSDATIGLSPEVRYSVCLMASTSGSAAAWPMNASIDVAKES